MELQNFIETTIKDISVGLHNSNNTMIKDKVGKGIPDLKEINIDFDIAVSASSINETELKGKITVLGFGINLSGANAEKLNENNFSRIKFSVPVKIKTNNTQPDIPNII